MRDIAVGKGAQHDGQGIGVADMSQELRAEAALLGCCLCALAHACDVHEFDGGVCDFPGIEDFCKRLQTRIGHLHDGDVGLHGAGRVAADGRSCSGERVEESSLPALWQADNTYSKSHIYSVPLFLLILTLIGTHFTICVYRSVFRRSEVTFYAIVRILLLGMQIQI